jgi:hypothetical protein
LALVFIKGLIMLKKVWCFSLFAMLVGCTASQVQTTPKSLNVQIGSNVPSGNAKFLGPITARHGGGCGLYGAEGNFQGAMTILRNKAAEMEANFVQILRQQGEHMTGLCLDRGYTIDGMAYQVGPSAQTNHSTVDRM